MEQQANNLEPQSGKLYTGRAPIILQVVGGLMWLNGLGLILSGILLLLYFGLGVILIILGVFNIRYAKKIFKMQKKGYGGSIFLQIALMTLVLIIYGIQGFNSINYPHIFTIVVAGLSILLVYLNKNKFIYD